MHNSGGTAVIPSRVVKKRAFLMQNSKFKISEPAVRIIISRGNIMDNTNNLIVEKSFNFAKRIVNLNKYLSSEKKEYTLSKQITRSGTSIGANVFEAQNAQSNADFASKMNIALKEATETLYWLMLLCETDYITQNEFKSLETDLTDIRNILSAICKTSYNK